MIEDEPQFLEHLLVNGEVDLAIMVSNALGDPRRMVVEVLTSSPNRVWLASSHPLAERAELTLADCAAVPQIVLEADRVGDVLRAVWTRHALRPEVMLRTSSLEAARSLVGVGAGITILPDFLYRPWTLDADHIEVRNLRDERAQHRRGPGLAARHAHARGGFRIHRGRARAVGRQPQPLSGPVSTIIAV